MIFPVSAVLLILCVILLLAFSTRVDGSMKVTKKATPNVVPMLPQHWERQDWDAPAEWIGFVVYRDMLAQRGRRHVGTVADTLSVSRGVVERWAADYHWDARAGAYDEWAGALMSESAIDELRSAGRTQGRLLAEWTECASVELRKLMTEVHNNPSSVLDPKLLLEVTKTTLGLQRLLDGKPTEHVRVSEEPDLSTLTDDELDTYRALLDKTATRKLRS